MTRHCPALLVAAPASGQGKTTVTAAIARRYARQGKRVRVFKAGPDFLDPMILQRASGVPVHSLDLWLVGENDCRALLYQAAGEVDLLLIEGVMGLFDGRPSSADLAQRFGIPVLAAIDASAMAQTFAALAHGLRSLRPELPFAGVFANRVGSERHFDMLLEALPEDLRVFGYLPSSADAAVPSRHLGLVQAQELEDLDRRLDAAADALQWQHDDLPQPVAFAPADMPEVPPLLRGRRVAVARDAAFAFIYPANLDVLVAAGAELAFFSPLTGDALPDADAVWLPGGYPELHLHALSENRRLARDLAAHVEAGKPLLAECGGMLALLDRLQDASGQSAAMFGLLPGQARLQKRFAALGPQEVELPEGLLRGHTYHHSKLESPLAPLVRARCPNGGPNAEAVYCHKRLTASYVHFWFPSNPAAALKLFLP